MQSLHPQFVTDSNGNKISVILPMQEFKEILETIKEMEDIRLYDAAKSGNEDFIPLEDYLKSRQENNHA
jgi:hypothetical protein